MMKPEYAACVAAIKLRGEPPDPDEPLDENDVCTRIRICDPESQQLVCYADASVKTLRGAGFITVTSARNVSAMYGGEDCQLPSAGHQIYRTFYVERADPDNPNEVYWMQIKKPAK